MAYHVETTLKLKASAGKTWATLADFGGIERFSSNVKSSPILDE